VLFLAYSVGLFETGKFILKKLRSVLSELKNIWEFFQINYPNTKLGYRLRAKYYSKNLSQIGSNPIIERGVLIGLGHLVKIGNDFVIGESATVAAGSSEPIFIGNQVAIARNSFIRSANHSFDDLNTPIMFQGHNFKTIDYRDGKYSIVIEDDVWVGANSVITSGSFIGRGSVIGANSVVSSTIPPYSIVMGNPARVVGSRQAIRAKT
jgi:acetyltransferase-like isoleucine patch superfamily enzyme